MSQRRSSDRNEGKRERECLLTQKGAPAEPARNNGAVRLVVHKHAPGLHRQANTRQRHKSVWGRELGLNSKGLHLGSEVAQRNRREAAQQPCTGNNTTRDQAGRRLKASRSRQSTFGIKGPGLVQSLRDERIGNEFPGNAAAERRYLAGWAPVHVMHAKHFLQHQECDELPSSSSRKQYHVNVSRSAARARSHGAVVGQTACQSKAQTSISTNAD